MTLNFLSFLNFLNFLNFKLKNMASLLEIELAKLKTVIVKIGVLSENQIIEAMKSLLSDPNATTKKLKKTENKIDKLDVKIDEICQNIFALQQPVASDLRFIISAMQISSEIERIGDLAISVIKNSKNVKEKYDLIIKFDIASIAKNIELITKKTNECFDKQQEKTIGEIFLLNKNIRVETQQVIENIISEMKTNSKAVGSGTNLILALKHLERIGEHCTNIAESIYFVINAKTIKHEKTKIE
ncbi:phosphate signaling complex protein PhoU [Flavobacterium psychrophilum]|nr:phosphate signaling complex protein PhoU [Flavobacterium psychrophilum]EKT4516306.1 phosphate signaling complex protein PhoU [Flavobacterium psychrophilum]SNB12938.1 Phosphate-specific transport system accessory protein PhoU [Flavobacterium psychrophilum]SNB97775.1 Phosphate-specific transport system accessory protein PhoU [Flavobacterium psychrophilum]